MKKQAGFTLVELMVILAVLAIVIGFGVPRLTGMMENNRTIYALNHLSAHLAYARSEAIKRSTTVSVVPTVAGDWTQGWTVFTDTNGDGVLDVGDTRLRVVDDLALPNTISIAGNSLTYNRFGSVSSGEVITLISTYTSKPVTKNLTVSIAGGVTIKTVP